MMYKILGAIDDFFDKTWNWFTAPRCKCKLKKGKNGRRTSNNK